MPLNEENIALFVSYVLNTKDVSVVELALVTDGPALGFDQGSVIHGTGIARRDPQDHSDNGLGLDLALARALTAVAKRANRRVTGKIKHNDDIRAMVHKPKAEVVKVSKPKKKSVAKKRAAKKH